MSRPLLSDSAWAVETPIDGFRCRLDIGGRNKFFPAGGVPGLGVGADAGAGIEADAAFVAVEAHMDADAAIGQQGHAADN